MLKRTDKILIVLGAFVILIAAVIAYLFMSGIIKSPFCKEKAPLQIGFILPFEGANADEAQAIKKAVNLKIKEINTRGGVDGRQINPIWENGGCNETKAAIAAERLIVRNRVKFIIGGYCQSELAGIASLAEEKEVLVISPNNEDLPEGNDFLFSLGSDNGAGLAAARYSREELDFEKASIIAERKKYTVDLTDDFQSVFEDLGGEILLRESLSVDKKFTDILNNLKNYNAGVIYLAVEIPALADEYIGLIREAGISSTIFVPEFTLSSEAIKEYENLSEAMSVSIQESEISDELEEEYYNEYNEELSRPILQARAYSAIGLIAAVADKYGEDANAAKDYLSNLRGWSSPLGDLSFSKEGYAIYPYRVLKAENGELKELKIYKP